MPETPNLQPGDRVRVVLDDVQVQVPVEGGYLTVNVGCDEIRFGLEEAGVTVERLAPAEWPPECGDLWQDKDGDLWFAILGKPGHNNTLLIGTNGATNTPDALNEAYGPLALLRREESREEYKPCGCDHHGDHAGCDVNCECAR